MSYKNPQDRRAWAREYYKNRGGLEKYREYVANHREKRSAYDREYGKTHRKEKNANERKRRISHPEQLLWSRARFRAKKKNLKFDIALQDINIPKHCPVLGVPLILSQTKGWAPSLDRIDAQKGYIKTNVWVISNRANMIKNDGTWQEHLLVVRALREKEVANASSHD